MDPKARAISAYCEGKRYPLPEPEFAWCPGRKFRADLGWPDQKLLVEFEGGIYGTGKPCPLCKQRRRGGHSSVSGIVRDIEKYNLAALHGYLVLRVTPLDVKTGVVFGLIDRLFGDTLKASKPQETR